MYNAEKILEKTIRSVAEQKNNYVEYIIIDGKSTDKTLEIINRYSGVVDYVKSEKDCGVYDAMNKGVGVAQGKYLYFLQAGDELCDDAIESMLKVIINNHETVSMIYGNVLWGQKNIVYDGMFDKYKMVRKNICQQSILYHKGCFEKQGLFEKEYKIVADYVFNIKCFGDKSIKKIYIDTIIANYDCGMSGDIPDSKLTRMKRYKLIFNNLGLLCVIYAVVCSLYNLIKNFSFKNYIDAY